jgi:hypothetical protein
VLPESLNRFVEFLNGRNGLSNDTKLDSIDDDDIALAEVLLPLSRVL